MLLRHHGGKRVWSVLREPTPEDEDARRTHRELARLTTERTAHMNRIGSLLVLHNLRPRLSLVKQQVKALEAERRLEVETGKQPVVAHLTQLRAIGLKTAWVLDQEPFGWRRFANRRELAGSLGLVPTPYDSGGSKIEQGISKAGNKRARALLVELAWGWLRVQPDSALTQWFNRRFAGSGKRMRRVGIVALARRLAIALWRYLEHGEIPAGAVLKPAGA